MEGISVPSLIFYMRLSLLLFEVCMAEDCDVTYDITSSDLNFTIFPMSKIACLRCVDGDMVFTGTSWMVYDENVLTLINDVYTFNSSLVEVVNGVLMVKQPLSQFVNGSYFLSALCSITVVHDSITLVEYDLPPACTMVNTAKNNNIGFIVDSSTVNFCLHCVDLNGQHDISTAWRVISENISPQEFSNAAELEDGFIVFFTPHMLIISERADSILIVCNGMTFEYNIRIYRRGLVLQPPVGLGSTIRVKEGYVINITCIHNNPLVFEDDVTWSNSSSIVSSSSTLLFNPIRRSDEGIYYCNLSRSGGQQASDFVILNVDYATSESPARQIVFPEIINVSLSCEYGNFVPSPGSVSWSSSLGILRNGFNGVIIRTSTHRTELIVMFGGLDLDYQRLTFTCIQTDSAGTLSQNFFIDFKPEPVSLRVASLTTDLITLKWTYQSDGSQIRTNVLVAVFRGSIAVIANMTVGVLDTSVTLGTFTPLTAYTVKVYTVSSLGSSKPATIETVTLSTGFDCSKVYVPTESGVSFSINESVAVACLECRNSDGVTILDAEWDVIYQNVQSIVSNTLSPNASVVEVRGGILAVKNPTEQFVNGYYDINAYCSAFVTYTFITLYKHSPPQDCDSFQIVSSSGGEVLIENSTQKLCLQCVDGKNRSHDPFTIWQVVQGNTSITLSDTATNSVGELEALQGYLKVTNPYSILVNNRFFTICSAAGFSYLLDLYSTEFVPPIVPANEVVREGTSVTILCIDNNPRSFGVSSYWLDSNENIVSRSSPLRYLPVSRADSGVYKCVLSTNDSRTKYARVSLVVQFVDSVYPSRITFFPGENITLSCYFNFIPHPSSISWKNTTNALENGTDGVIIISDNAESILKIYVERQGISVSRRYNCLQVDTSITGILSLFFQVNFFPEPVSKLLVTALSKSSIIVSWIYQLNGSSPRMAVDLKLLKGDIIVSTMTKEPDVTEVTISDLTSQTLYRVKVYSVNGFGRSAAAMADISTLTDPVPLILTIAIPLSFLVVLSVSVLLLYALIFLSRWRTQQRKYILSKKTEEGMEITSDETEYNFFARIKRKIIGEDVYESSPKYISRGTDTEQDSRRESLFIQGLKYFPRRLSRAVGAEERVNGDDYRRKSLFWRKMSTPDGDTSKSKDFYSRKTSRAGATTQDAKPHDYSWKNSRRRSTHYRRKSMAEAAGYDLNVGKPGDPEEMLSFYQRKKSTADGGHVHRHHHHHHHHHRRESSPGDIYEEKDTYRLLDGENFKVDHHRRRSTHHRRKSTPDGAVYGIDGEEFSAYHHRRRSTHHRRKSTPDGVIYKMTDRDGMGSEEFKVHRHRRRSTHHRRNSVPDGAIHKVTDTDAIDGEDFKGHHHRRRSTHHRRKSAPDGAIHKMTDMDAIDGEDFKAHHHRRRSTHHRRKSAPDGAIHKVTDMDAIDGEDFKAHRHRERSTHYKNTHHRRKPTPDNVVHDIKDADGEEYYHRRKRKSAPDIKDTDRIDSEEYKAHQHRRRSMHHHRKSTPGGGAHEIKDAYENINENHYRRISTPDDAISEIKDEKADSPKERKESFDAVQELKQSAQDKGEEDSKLLHSLDQSISEYYSSPRKESIVKVKESAQDEDEEDSKRSDQRKQSSSESHYPRKESIDAEHEVKESTQDEGEEDSKHSDQRKQTSSESHYPRKETIDAEHEVKESAQDEGEEDSKLLHHSDQSSYPRKESIDTLHEVKKSAQDEDSKLVYNNLDESKKSNSGDATVNAEKLSQEKDHHDTQILSAEDVFPKALFNTHDKNEEDNTETGQEKDSHDTQQNTSFFLRKFINIYRENGEEDIKAESVMGNATFDTAMVGQEKEQETQGGSMELLLKKTSTQDSKAEDGVRKTDLNREENVTNVTFSDNNRSSLISKGNLSCIEKLNEKADDSACAGEILIPEKLPKTLSSIRDTENPVAQAESKHSEISLKMS